MSLYHPSFERDNCGFGLIAQMDGEASHRIVRTAIHGLDRMKHRGALPPTVALATAVVY